MKKQKIFMALIGLMGTAVFVFSAIQTIAFFSDPETLFENILYSVVVLVLMLLCHMLPIYITADKTMEISFVPVVACIVTKGVPLSIVLFTISTMLSMLQDSKTHQYYSPWVRAPLKELFNVSNVLVANWIGGFVYNLIAIDSTGSVFTWRVVIGAVAFSFIAIFGNLVFFLLYFRFSDQGRFFTLLRENIGGIIPNILATVPLGLFIGYLLMQKNAYLWIILFMGPLLLARYSFKVYLDSHMILLRTIASLVEAIEATGHKFKYVHCNNSAGGAYHPNKQCTMARSGTTLYGHAPDPGRPVPGLRTAMQWKAVIAQLKWLDPGAVISYGCTYEVKERSLIAVVAVGYADGLSRLLSGKISLLVNGKLAPNVGKICMDQLMIDVTGIEGVEEGQTVTLFGDDCGVHLDAWEMAKEFGQHPIVMQCNISKRVPRVYFKGGREVAETNYLTK